MSSNKVAVVHNGIIENHDLLRAELITAGYEFVSDTDTEVIAHLVDLKVNELHDLEAGVRGAIEQLQGAYAIAVIHGQYPDTIVAARSGSPLVVGVGFGENFVASDPQALRPVTDRFVFLNEGEFAVVTPDEVSIAGVTPEDLSARVVTLAAAQDAGSKGNYRHFMLKEIHEQPETVEATLEGRLSENSVLVNAFGAGATEVFEKTKAIQIVACCGSSYYTGLVARYWAEQLLGIPCQVEIASEFRYRSVAVIEDTLFCHHLAVW